MDAQPHLDLVNEAWNEAIQEIDSHNPMTSPFVNHGNWLDRCRTNAALHEAEGREDAITGNGHGNGTPGCDGGGLPTDAQERKRTPIYSGVLMYFPDAIAEVAQTSWAGNEQHHPGTPLHWDRSKSTDEHDAMLRHAMQAGTRDSDGIRHSAKVAWRALAALQKEIEADLQLTELPC